MNKTNNLKPILFLIISWLIVFMSIYLEAIWRRSLFSRAGFLMVFFANIPNHNLLKGRDKYQHGQLKSYSGV